MVRQCPVLVVLFSLLAGATPRAGAQPDMLLPTPRRVRLDDDWTYSTSEFERIVSKLKAEREAGSSADWQALQKRNTPPTRTVDAEQRLFQMHLKKALEHLQQAPARPAVRSAPGTAPAKKSSEHDGGEHKKADKTSDTSAETAPAVVDALAQAHALLRTKQYDEALATFQQINLKGKKTEERAPIQYLKACCLQHLGKTKEANELFLEVANCRGDEPLAGYAQWQLEMLRWHRDLDQRLQEVRQRHQAVEKR